MRAARGRVPRRPSRPGASRAALASVLAGVALTGCGGATELDRAARTSAAAEGERAVAAPAEPAESSRSEPAGRPQAPPVGPPADDLGLPPAVPLRATGPAATGDLRVIGRWLAALRAGDVRRAARSFRLPSRFQNGTAVLWLSVPAERVEANRSLTCGARLLSAGGAGAYVVVRLRLVDRPGARCGAGAGRTARAAIRVEFASIVEFYRLPADPRARPARLAPHPARTLPEGPAA